jgi:hypothetical protein
MAQGPVPLENSPGQRITAGDGSTNYAAGQNMTIHHVQPVKESPIVKATLDDVIKYDPKAAELIDVVSHNIHLHHSMTGRLIVVPLIILTLLLTDWGWKLVQYVLRVLGLN